MLNSINYYTVFYWITRADDIKSFFDSLSNWFTFFSILFFFVYIIVFICKTVTIDDNNLRNTEEEIIDPTIRSFNMALGCLKPIFYTSFIVCILSWTLWVFIPTKKDAIIIIAGGAVGNFITSDSSVKAIPAELTLLVREKLKSEIEEAKSNLSGEIIDTLANKSKEELIEMIKKK